MKYHFFLAVLAVLASCRPATDKIEFANTIEIDPADSRSVVEAKAAHVLPTPLQADALDREFIAFIHWGPNTFTASEWGTGTEDPTVFNPTGIDADQWAQTMKEAGIKMVIFTAKHHEGYVLWPSRYTDHGIVQSPYQDGKADVMREISEAARRHGLQLGVYLSPADLYQIESPTGLYGNGSKQTPRVIPAPVEGRPFATDTTFTYVLDDYNEYFMNQLFELLTDYGPIHEVWFDGANPKPVGGQQYNYKAWIDLVHALAPEAVMFGTPDVRWCGNEAGETRESEWNVVPYSVHPDSLKGFEHNKDTDIGSIDKLLAGRYLHYQLPETDTSIRAGWFWRDDTAQHVRPAAELFDIYERTVGGNSVLLLNIPPNRDGRFSDRDVESLQGLGRMIQQTYGVDLAQGAQMATELADGDLTTAVDASKPIEVTLPEAVTFNRVVLAEPIRTTGERIEQHAVEAFVDGEWVEVARATNVGHKRILRFEPVTTDRLRVKVLKSRLQPSLSHLSLHLHTPEA